MKEITFEKLSFHQNNLEKGEKYLITSESNYYKIPWLGTFLTITDDGFNLEFSNIIQFEDWKYSVSISKYFDIYTQALVKYFSKHENTYCTKYQTSYRRRDVELKISITSTIVSNYIGLLKDLVIIHEEVNSFLESFDLIITEKTRDFIDELLS